MLASVMDEAGILAIVRSAFDETLEIREYTKLEELEEEQYDADINEEFADFDRRKAEEEERLTHLFEAKEHDRKQDEKMSSMEEELADFKNRKLIDPFAEDDE